MTGAYLFNLAILLVLTLMPPLWSDVVGQIRMLAQSEDGIINKKWWTTGCLYHFANLINLSICQVPTVVGWVAFQGTHYDEFRCPDSTRNAWWYTSRLWFVRIYHMNDLLFRLMVHVMNCSTTYRATLAIGGLAGFEKSRGSAAAIGVSCLAIFLKPSKRSFNRKPHVVWGCFLKQQNSAGNNLVGQFPELTRPPQN